jgi:hypothetical protein
MRRDYFLPWEVTIEQLNEPLVTLAADIPANVYAELRTWRANTNRRRKSAFARQEYPFIGRAPWDGHLIAAAAQRSKPDLRTLLNVASTYLGDHESVFQLGTEVGRYKVFVTADDPFLESPPGLDGIVAAAKSLPRKLLGRLPVLKKLLAAASRPRARGARRILCSALKGHAQDFREYGADKDLFVVGQPVSALDNAIHEGLQESELSKPKPSNVVQPLVDPKPSWVKERNGAWVGELRIGDRVVRKLRAKAENVIAVLDAFEEKGWPDAIDDPSSQDNWQRRHETIRSLNQGLKVIRFHGDGTNRRIKWTRVR